MERFNEAYSLEDRELKSTIGGSNDGKNMTTADQISHQSSLRRNGASQFNVACRTLERRTSTLSDHRDSEYDDMASLAFTENDDGTTDSSDDSYTSGSQSTENKRDQGSTKNGTDSYNNAKPVKQCEVGKYMAAREMTPFQERMNALTVLPNTYYCIMFFLSGSWLSKSFIEAHAHEMIDDNDFDTSQCINWSWLPNLHAMPPLAPLAAAIGILCHAPFSMIYHWKYAHRLPPGLARTIHWSRRMDQAMIHFCSACMSYSTSGRFDFFLINTLFNMDCFYRQFLPKVQPKRNQRRIGMSIFMYTIPLFTRGEFSAYMKLAFLFPFGGWLFGRYPIGGWSHSAFHIVMTFVPPIMMATALNLSSSQSQLEVAAQCAILADQTLAL